MKRLQIILPLFYPASERGSKPASCPICGKPAAGANLPFCSERCQLVDLSHWFGGRYAVPTPEQPEEAEPEEN